MIIPASANDVAGVIATAMSVMETARKNSNSSS